MIIEHLTISGHPANVGTCVRKKISALTRRDRVIGFKIGITCDPPRRWSEAYKWNYDRMFTVYVSESSKFVDRLERELIDHNWNIDFCHNKISGGGGPKSPYGSYYLYVAVKY